MGLAPIIVARWLLIWNPQGDSQAAVRLFGWPMRVDPVPATELAVIGEDRRQTPVTAAQELGPKLQALAALREPIVLCQQVRGTPIVFGSSLEIVWELPGGAPVR
jgi:hypothetical protein